MGRLLLPRTGFQFCWFSSALPCWLPQQRTCQLCSTQSCKLAFIATPSGNRDYPCTFPFLWTKSPSILGYKERGCCQVASLHVRWSPFPASSSCSFCPTMAKLPSWRVKSLPTAQVSEFDANSARLLLQVLCWSETEPERSTPLLATSQLWRSTLSRMTWCSLRVKASHF